MKRLFVVLVVMLTLAGTARADTLESVDDVRALVQRAMDHVHEGNTFILFNLLKPYYPFGDDELTDLMVTTVEQRKSFLERFGETVEIVLVDERMVAESVLRITYLEKLERHIIRWVFTFYRPGDRWIVNAILWNDNIDALFK